MSSKKNNKKKKKKIKNRRAFTLVELLAVIVILGLLLSVAVPAVSKYINQTRDDTYSLHEANMKVAVSNMMSVCEQKDTENCIPESGNSRVVYLSELIEGQYSGRLKDPADTDNYCSEDESYVVVINVGDGYDNLSYSVCLKCSNYASDGCGEISTNSCTDDDVDPVCGEVVGGSTLWTNEDRVISVGCSDSDCGCSQTKYYKTFTETAKTGTITIRDKAGNETSCTVNVYVDKKEPTCTLSVSGSKGDNDWYGGTAPVVTLTSYTDGESGVATYGMGTSKGNYNFDKTTSYTVSTGITTVYGYVKDNAGNVGTCSVEVKYDPTSPTQDITYGYQVYEKDDIATTSGGTITLNSIIGEYGSISGVKIYLSSNSSGISSSTIKYGSTILATRTINSGVLYMEYTFDAGSYNSLTIDLKNSTNVSNVSRIELITDHTNGFYTNKNVTIYINSHDSLSGKAYYTFNNGSSWSSDYSKTYSTNQTNLKLATKDSAGNISDYSTISITNIDKLTPTSPTFTKNGGTYTINVGNTTVSASTKVTGNDASATSNYAKSGVRSISYAWSTSNTTRPTSYTSISNGGTVSASLTGGSHYLWIKTVDYAGNIGYAVSSDFNVGYQVTYDCNGGSNCPSDQRKVYNQTLTLSSTKPTRSGYEFVGWGTLASSTSSSYSAGGSYTSNSAIKLYAIWRKTLSFTFNANGATISKTSASCYLYNSDTSCNITLPTITRSGFDIKGFNTTSSATSNASGWTSGATVSVNTSTNTTWYAITKKEITITFNKNSASSIGATSGNCTIWNSASECSITSPSITASSGYSVVGWNTSSSGTTSQWEAGTQKDISSSTTYYAIQSKTVTVTFDKNSASSIGATSGSCTMYNSSKSCKITSPSITASSGYTAVGWNTSSSGTTSGWAAGAQKDISSSTTYYAIQSKTVTVTFDKNSASSIGATSGSCTMYNSSTSCKITSPSITAPSGYSVVGWNTSKSATTSSWDVDAQKSISSSTTYYAIVKKSTSLATICNTYSSSDLFGSSKGSISGNFGTWHSSLGYTYTCYANNTTCTRSNGYDRICVTDACGAYKGMTAAEMREESSACEKFSKFWCSCNTTGTF